MISPDLLFYKFKPWKKAFITAVQRIKSNPPKDLDQQFERLHDAVFEKIDCLECANCCKTTSPMFFEKDIDRLSKALGMKTSAFVSEYLVRDKDDIYALKSTPCPFWVPIIIVLFTTIVPKPAENIRTQTTVKCTLTCIY